LAGSFANDFQVARDTIYNEFICEKRVMIHLRGVTADFLNSQRDVF
jgi:hypothetical protein